MDTLSISDTGADPSGLSTYTPPPLEIINIPYINIMQYSKNKYKEQNQYLWNYHHIFHVLNEQVAEKFEICVRCVKLVIRKVKSDSDHFQYCFFHCDISVISERWQFSPSTSPGTLHQSQREEECVP